MTSTSGTSEDTSDGLPGEAGGDIDTDLATDAGSDDGASAAPSQASGSRQLLEWVLIIAGALAVALVVRSVAFQAFFIPSGSMENTLLIHDRVLVNKLAYRFHDIRRGDVVVFKRPPAEIGNPEIKDLIKRVIGLPNETIEGVNGQVYVNGHPLEEPYVKGGPLEGIPLTRTTLGAHQYLVLGDNRGNSNDGRFFGPIDGKLIVGRAFVKVWPITDLSQL